MGENRDKITTINQLLECGLELFGKYGYNSVTTKQISEYSGLNSALISYYFGGKAQYYLEVVSYVSDLMVNWFDDIKIDSLDDKTVGELEDLIKAVVDKFYTWFTSARGVSSTNLFFQELITGTCTNVKTRFKPAVESLRSYFIDLFRIYYQKTNREHVNPIFVWALLISINQNISLHSSATEEVRATLVNAEIPKNMLNLILNMP